MPKGFVYLILVLLAALMIPPALIARRRASLSAKPRIHLVQDMDNQRKLQAQQSSDLFRDNRAMRPLVPGAVARGELPQGEHYERGVIGEQWATSLPSQITVNRAMIERGRDRFGIYCSPCHGHAGYGDGMIHQRAMILMDKGGINGTAWVEPKSLHDPTISSQAIGRIYNTVTNGIRNMAGYKAQVPADDRWAIVVYVRALQMSQNADVDAIPPALKPDTSAAASDRTIGDQSTGDQTTGDQTTAEGRRS